MSKEVFRNDAIRVTEDEYDSGDLNLHILHEDKTRYSELGCWIEKKNGRIFVQKRDYVLERDDTDVWVYILKRDQKCGECGRPLDE